MEEQDHEFSTSRSEELDEELDWSEGEWEDLPKAHASEFLGYDFLNRGIEAGVSSKSQPCSKVFLDELLHDLCMWNVKLLYSMETYCNLDTDLDDDTKAVVEHIYGAMDECTRLRLHPELFLSEKLRMEFLSQVASISEDIMVQLSKVAHKMDFFARASKHDFTRPVPVKLRKVGGVYYRIRNPAVADPEGLHRTRTNRKPWNKWLNNRKKPGTGIEQRIPDTGHKMLRRVQYMYSCIESSFEKTGRVLGQSKNGALLASATGEDYSILLTPLTHPHYNVPLAFYSDPMSQMSHNGAVKLEAIGVACACFQRRGLMPKRSGVLCQVVHRN